MTQWGEPQRHCLKGEQPNSGWGALNAAPFTGSVQTYKFKNQKIDERFLETGEEIESDC